MKRLQCVAVEGPSTGTLQSSDLGYESGKEADSGKDAAGGCLRTSTRLTLNLLLLLRTYA